ncbi:dihydrofolate reductase family protein [Actinomadura soli]|uniref:dihydrofolate reductase family protein n=1 Tax=Actinomadura soli TaxID=2508997 RepID=UPI00197A82A4|nr:dihydrofolate reductase family protein [Actinomadura soli]
MVHGRYRRYPTADPDRLTYLTSEATARYLRELQKRIGACVVGRNLFDLTAGWNGRHPSGVPVFVVTHRPPPAGWEATTTPFTFVSDGVENAIARAREVAGHRDVGVGPGGTVADALRAGLLDELRMDIVPVVLGAGTPMLTGLGDTAPIGFDPAEIIEGDRRDSPDLSPRDAEPQVTPDTAQRHALSCRRSDALAGR